MLLSIQIFVIAASLIFNIMIVMMLRSGTLELKYSILWILSGILMLTVSIFPGVNDYITALLGIAEPINTLFFSAIVFSLIMLLGLTMIVTRLKNKVYRLAQTISILEKKLYDLQNAAEERS